MNNKVTTYKIIDIDNGDIGITYNTKEDKVGIKVVKRIVKGDIIATDYIDMSLDYAKHLVLTLNELFKESIQ